MLWISLIVAAFIVFVLPIGIRALNRWAINSNAAAAEAAAPSENSGASVGAVAGVGLAAMDPDVIDGAGDVVETGVDVAGTAIDTAGDAVSLSGDAISTAGDAIGGLFDLLS